MRTPFNQRKHDNTVYEQRGCSYADKSPSTFRRSAVERTTERLGMDAYERNLRAYVASLTFSERGGQLHHYACPIVAPDKRQGEAIALESLLENFPPSDGYGYHAVHLSEMTTSEIEQVARTLPALNQLFGGVQEAEINQSEYADEPVWCDIPGCRREAAVWSPRNGGMNLCHKHHRGGAR